MAMNGLSALPGAGRYAGVLGGVLALGYSLTQSLFQLFLQLTEASDTPD